VLVCSIPAVRDDAQRDERVLAICFAAVFLEEGPVFSYGVQILRRVGSSMPGGVRMASWVRSLEKFDDIL